MSVDIGGTFTDIVLAVDSQLHSHKVLTTAREPEIAALSGIAHVLKFAELELVQVDSIIHGTTLATNALIERRGAKTALVTTRGFRDVLEMRNEKRFDQYALNITLPVPLVPRDRRFTLDERILADGTILRAPCANEIKSLAVSLLELEIESVAVGFLHSYRYPVHEQYVASELANLLGSSVTVCQSAEVANEIREFDRFSTVCANAYVRPLMSAYLNKFKQALEANRFTGAFLVMLSGGGLTTLEQAVRTPIRLVESGPAGGAMLAAHISRELDSPQTLALDIGGTTAKICFIENSVPQTTRRFEVARAWKNIKGSGLPVRVPTIELVEIGAGGGSIAKVDSLGRIKVGPESAGAAPGPCAYGQGGTAATVTDAHIAVGNIVPAGFADGAITLTPKFSRDAISNQLAKPLGVNSCEVAAAGVIEIADELMANAARVHGIELGKNIGQFDLLVSGGGGPLHATRIAEKLGIRRIIVPENAGVGSAVGFLHAPISFEVAVTVMQSIETVDASAVQEKLTVASNRVSNIVKSVEADSPIKILIEAELRYTGQDLDLRVDFDTAQPFSCALTSLQQRFVTRFHEIHGFVLEDIPVELIGFSITGKVATVTDVATLSHANKRSHDTDRNYNSNGVRPVYDLDSDTWINYAVCSRAGMACEKRVAGPAVLSEQQTTTLVRDGWVAQKQASGHLVLERSES